MLAIDGGESDFVLVMPRRHGGVVDMLLALEDAGLGVSRIEPHVGEDGRYRLIVSGSAEIAVRILERIGCTVTASPHPPPLGADAGPPRPLLIQHRLTEFRK